MSKIAQRIVARFAAMKHESYKVGDKVSDIHDEDRYGRVTNVETHVGFKQSVQVKWSDGTTTWTSAGLLEPA